MAFTFLVEDGTGLTDATSYVSLEEADDMITVNIHADAKWSVLADEVKEKLLSWASRYLDNHTRWFGQLVFPASALRWPRKGVCDRDGRMIADDEVPRQLKIAVASMATYLIDQDRSVEREQDALVRLKADVVELEFQEGYRLAQVPAHMRFLIAGLGVVTSGYPRFARIIR